MNDKFREFFIRSKILTSEDFDQIINYASFVFNKNKANNNSRIVIVLKKILTVELFKKIMKGVGLCKGSFEFEIHGNNSEFTVEDVKQYFLYFINTLPIDKTVINNLLKFVDVKVNKNDITISYFDNFEEETLNNLNQSLLNMFKFAGFNVNKLEFVFSKDKQNIELYKKQKIDEIECSIKEIKLINEDEAKVLLDNKIKAKNFTNIVDISPDVKYATLECQIFKVESKKKKDGGYIYMYWVTDFTSAIKIKGFTSNENLAYNGQKSNLPFSYLSKFSPNDWVHVECIFNIGI